LGALRNDSFITPLKSWQVALISVLPLFLLMAGFLRWRPGVILVVSLTLMLVILLASIAILRAKYWFPPGAALIGVIAVYPLWGWRRLQAVSDFLGNELGELQREDEIAAIPLHRRQEGDLVGRQSAALAEAIDHIRDLRRFITDTMHDLPDPMVVTDLEGKVTLESDQVRFRMRQTTMGKQLDNLLQHIVLPEHKSALHEYLQQNRGQSEVPTNGPDFVRFVTNTGSTFALRKTPLQSADGTLQGHVHYFADITALAQAQLEREQALQLLSHDMRAPQSAIIAALSGKLDSEARDRIERNARRTMQLAQDFVDMARMEDSEFTGEDVLLVELLRDAADNLWPLAKEKAVKIELLDESDAGFVLAEPDSLSRAFANLLDNAIKYSPHGGVIHIGINKVVSNDRSELCVQISDDGPGIAKAMLPKLFARFASTGETRGRTQGMGLGLSFVATIVRRHGGEVHGKNLPEGGSCFVVTLPEAEEPEDDLSLE
jgi:signal transduction histidine kinase